eukprot:scaffold98767_cov63-Phaeocystis_antarctica.AAC.4
MPARPIQSLLQSPCSDAGRPGSYTPTASHHPSLPWQVNQSRAARGLALAQDAATQTLCEVRPPTPLATASATLVGHGCREAPRPSVSQVCRLPLVGTMACCSVTPGV